jgi:hypothetical protein
LPRLLAGHEVTKAIVLGWERIPNNGELLTKAEAEGFELLLTTDKNIRYQQNLKGRKIAVVVLGISRGAWRESISIELQRRWTPPHPAAMPRWKFRSSKARYPLL